MLSWQEAENRCQRLAEGGHLTSIRNAQEAQFIHYMLTSTWAKPEANVYIGKYEWTVFSWAKKKCVQGKAPSCQMR